MVMVAAAAAGGGDVVSYVCASFPMKGGGGLLYAFLSPVHSVGYIADLHTSDVK